MAAIDRSDKNVGAVKAAMKAIDKSTCCDESSSIYRGGGGTAASGSVGNLSKTAKKANVSKTKKASFG
jgi:hypothetical protein